MSTLNARANHAYHEATEEHGFDHQRDAFEEGWETGYKAAAEEHGVEVARLTMTVQDVARALRIEAEVTADEATAARLNQIADDLTGGAS